MVDNELITKVRSRNVKSILSNVFTSSGGGADPTNGNGTTANGSAVDLGGTTSANTTVTGQYDQTYEKAETFTYSGSYTASSTSRLKLSRTNFNYLSEIIDNRPGGAPFNSGTRTAILSLTNPNTVSGSSDYSTWRMSSEDGTTYTNNKVELKLDPISFSVLSSTTDDVSNLYLSANLSQTSYIGNTLYRLTIPASNEIYLGTLSAKKFGYDATGSFINLGSDDTGDTYQRNSLGYLERVPIGANTYVYTSNGTTAGWAAPSGGGLTVGTSTITSGTNTRVLYNNSGVVGEYTVSGSGNVAMTTSPTFTTPALGTPTSGTLTNATGYLLNNIANPTGTTTLALSTNPFILTSGVTTGTGATAGIQNVFNSLTTGNGLDISSSSLTTGAIQKIISTSTAINNTAGTNGVFQIGVSGAMSSSRSAVGISSIVTTTGTTSKNFAGVFSASGATTNMAIYVPSGVVTIGAESGSYTGRLNVAVGSSGRIAQFGTLEIGTSAPTFSGTGIVNVNANRKITFFGGNFGTDNDMIDINWGATSVNRSGVDLGIIRSSLGAFATGTFQANSIAAFRFTDTWPTLTTPLNVVYGFDYNAGGAGNAVSEVAIRATRGQVVLGATGTSSANDRVKINGIGTTTGKGLVVNNSSGTERFSVQDDGVINVNGSGGTAGQVLVSNGTSAAAWAAGGIGGSTGATDNSILRADGTGGATLQNSGLFIDDSANLTIGTVSLSGNKTISAVNSTSDANLTLTSQGTVVVDVASSAESFQVMTTNDRVIINPAGFQLFGEKINASANATFLVSGAQGITGATTGQNLLLQAGSGYATGVTNGGHLYLMYGAKNSTGTDGNIGLLTSSVANWQSMERGVYLGNRLTAPTTGIANGVALFAEDSNSLSEFYVMPESGAKVNISGLFEPVTESGTSFTLNETHRNKIVLCSNSGVVTVTVGSGKAAGWNCMLVATHATGTITLSASGTTINGTTVTTTQFETLSLVHYGSENYLSKLG